MDRYCPICKRQLEESSETNHLEYNCKPWSRDHHYAEAVKDDEVLRIKIRLTDDTSKFYLHINIKEDYSEVWTQPNDIGGRVRINKALIPDFTNLDMIKNKLQTYLLLS